MVWHKLCLTWASLTFSLSVLQISGHWVHCWESVGWSVANHHCGDYCGMWGQLPGALHLPLHPGDIFHPHLHHLHLWNLRQTGEGKPSSSILPMPEFHFSDFKSVFSHCNAVYLNIITPCHSSDFASLQIFKAHPLILNYDHLNATLENPWYSKVEQTSIYDNATGNTTVIINTINPSYPNTALLSMCLMFGCFFIAYFLRQFKNGTFLPGKVSWPYLCS